MPDFYDPVVVKTNLRITVAYASCFFLLTTISMVKVSNAITLIHYSKCHVTSVINMINVNF